MCFVVVLPTLGFLWLAYQRREGALKDLAEVKSLLLLISLAHRDWLPPGAVSPIHHATVMQQLFSLVGEQCTCSTVLQVQVPSVRSLLPSALQTVSVPTFSRPASTQGEQTCCCMTVVLLRMLLMTGLNHLGCLQALPIDRRQDWHGEWPLGLA